MSIRILVLLVVAGLVYTANIGGTSVYILDEAKNAGCAMEMYQRGDWVVPTFNDALRTDKPPLHYYFMKVGYNVFGINPFAARIFSSLMGMLTIVVVFLFTRKLLNETVAFYASLILISSLQLAVQFHLAVPDPYLIFFLTCGWLSFAYAFINNKTVYYYLFYSAIAFATLAKGPVAIVFSGLLVLIFLLAQRKFTWQTLMQVKVIQGTLLFLLVVLPWYIAVGIETQGEWLEQFFFKHNVNRFTSSMEGHGGFPLASFVIVLGALMPFSFFFPQAFKIIWKDQKQNPFIQFCGIAMLLVVIFFAFSRTILPNYPEPAVPFFAILIAYFFHHIQTTDNLKRFRVTINAVLYFIVAMLMPVVVWFALQAESSLQDLRSLAFYFMLFPIGAAIALLYIIRKNIRAAVYAYSFTSILFLLTFFYILFPKIDAHNPVSQSIPLIEDRTLPIVAYRDFNPAFVFAFQHPVKKFETDETLLAFEKFNKHFYVITQKKYLPELSAYGFTILFEGKDLFEQPITVVLKK